MLSNGAPKGFFGERGDGCSSGSGNASAGSGMMLAGQVYDYAEMQRKRPFYVDVARARKSNVISALLRIPVSPEVAMKFDAHWSALEDDPGTFNILGGNCSTAASRAFKKAGIISGGIPGLDTPDNLWSQLSKKYGSRAQKYFGYLDFVPTNAGFKVTMTTKTS